MPGYDKLKTFISEHENDQIEFEIPAMTSDIVYSHIRGMSSTKATGLDGIAITLIKLSADIITPHLTGIYNLSIASGVMPNNWKKARVVPIFKSGNANELCNYRPISMLLVLSKILERHVYGHYY